MRKSTEIRELKTREAKCWKVIDQYLAESDRKKVPAVVKLEAAVFILKRLYPEKRVVEGGGENGEFKVIVEIADENNPAQESGNRISQYLEI